MKDAASRSARHCGAPPIRASLQGEALLMHPGKKNAKTKESFLQGHIISNLNVQRFFFFGAAVERRMWGKYTKSFMLQMI